MRANLTNREHRALVEVEVTLHPEAIREACLGQDGGVWKLLRFSLGTLVFLWSLGTELALPRFFPEVPLHPLALFVAYLAVRSSFGLAMTVACCAGFLLDAGCGVLPGTSVLPMMLMTIGLRGLRRLPAWQGLGGWGRAVTTGVLAQGWLSLYGIVFLSIGLTWDTWLQLMLKEFLLGMALAGFAAAPVFFFLLDCVEALRTGQPLFLVRAPKPEETAPKEVEMLS